MYSSGSSVEAMRAVARRITDERGMRRLRLCVARFRGARRGGAVRALAFWGRRRFRTGAVLKVLARVGPVLGRVGPCCWRVVGQDGQDSQGQGSRNVW